MDNVQTEIIKLSELGESLGPRGLGKELRECALTHIRAQKTVLFNFAGMKVISSQFADELFGRLFAELGKEQFAASVKINGFDNEDAKKLILTVIQKGIEFRLHSSAAGPQI
jgi:hypothetical protein